MDNRVMTLVSSLNIIYVIVIVLIHCFDSAGFTLRLWHVADVIKLRLLFNDQSLAPEADPGFWFGRGTGREHGGQKPEECYVTRLKKNTYGEKKVSPYRLRLYDNIIIIIISSIHRFMFPAIFVLKYKTQSAYSRAGEMVHNGSRA